MPDLTVRHVEMIPVQVPFREVPARNMVRELPHWTLFELWKVTLACGVVGAGETIRYDTWGAGTADDAKRLLERNAVERLWDDSLGAGLQMALFDAVGKANDGPVHRLLGHPVCDRAFVSWWDIDIPADPGPRPKGGGEPLGVLRPFFPSPSGLAPTRLAAQPRASGQETAFDPEDGLPDRCNSGSLGHGSKTGTGTSPEPVFWVVVEGWLGGESPFLNHAGRLVLHFRLNQDTCDVQQQIGPSDRGEGEGLSVHRKRVPTNPVQRC